MQYPAKVLLLEIQRTTRDILEEALYLFDAETGQEAVRHFDRQRQHARLSIRQTEIEAGQTLQIALLPAKTDLLDFKQIVILFQIVQHLVRQVFGNADRKAQRIFRSLTCSALRCRIMHELVAQRRIKKDVFEHVAHHSLELIPS
jgi:hypothetical protein